jgi:hypothetical protein
VGISCLSHLKLMPQKSSLRLSSLVVQSQQYLDSEGHFGLYFLACCLSKNEEPRNRQMQYSAKNLILILLAPPTCLCCKSSRQNHQKTRSHLNLPNDDQYHHLDCLAS